MKIEIEHEGSCLSASGGTGRLIAENAMKRSAPTSTVLPAGLPLRILRLPEVCFVTGLGRSMIYQMEAEHPRTVRRVVRERPDRQLHDAGDRYPSSAVHLARPILEA
jgi:hypothetical protein